MCTIWQVCVCVSVNIRLHHKLTALRKADTFQLWFFLEVKQHPSITAAYIASFSVEYVLKLNYTTS